MSSVAETVQVPELRPKAVVALLKAADVECSLAFYEKLGFEVGNEPPQNEQGVKTLAWMQHGSAAQIMLTRASRSQSAEARGVAVGEVKYPFWSPKGEFRVDDPDGWTWMVC